jgi:hypothetical protein
VLASHDSPITVPVSRPLGRALVSSAGFRVSRKQASRDCAVAAGRAIVNVELVSPSGRNSRERLTFAQQLSTKTGKQICTLSFKEYNYSSLCS